MLSDDGFLSVTYLAGSSVRYGGRVWTWYRIYQASEKIQDGHSQSKHPERKGLRVAGSTIS